MPGQTIVASEFSTVTLVERAHLSATESPQPEGQRHDVLVNALSRRLWTLEIHRRLEIKARDLLGQQ